MKSFHDLKVWEKAHLLVLTIYKVTQRFPNDEKFSLISQVRRSAISIPANIVEGFKRKSDKDFSHFLNIAEGSSEETKYYLILSKDLRYIASENYEVLIRQSEEVGRMLQGLIKKLNS